MSDLTLGTAQTTIAAALARARADNLQPLSIVVLDIRGEVKAAASEDGTSLKRFEVAHGKAYGALALGLGSRSIQKRAKQQGYWISAVSHVVGGALMLLPGGILISDAGGLLIGAVGVSGDTSDNDESVGLAAIQSAELIGNP